MGKPRWYKFSKKKITYLIIFSVAFIVLTIIEYIFRETNKFMFSLAPAFIIIAMLISHPFTSLRKKKVGEGLISLRKKFLFLYSSLNVFDTEWGLLSFGDKITINYGDKTITGYLSVVTDYVQIVDKRKMVVLIDKKEITSIINEGDPSFNNE